MGVLDQPPVPSPMEFAGNDSNKSDPWADRVKADYGGIAETDRAYRRRRRMILFAIIAGTILFAAGIGALIAYFVFGYKKSSKVDNSDPSFEGLAWDQPDPNWKQQLETWQNMDVGPAWRFDDFPSSGDLKLNHLQHFLKDDWYASILVGYLPGSMPNGTEAKLEDLVFHWHDGADFIKGFEYQRKAMDKAYFVIGSIPSKLVNWLLVRAQRHNVRFHNFLVNYAGKVFVPYFHTGTKQASDSRLYNKLLENLKGEHEPQHFSVGTNKQAQDAKDVVECAHDLFSTYQEHPHDETPPKTLKIPTESLDEIKTLRETTTTQFLRDFVMGRKTYALKASLVDEHSGDELTLVVNKWTNEEMEESFNSMERMTPSKGNKESSPFYAFIYIPKQTAEQIIQFATQANVGFSANAVSKELAYFYGAAVIPLGTSSEQETLYTEYYRRVLHEIDKVSGNLLRVIWDDVDAESSKVLAGLRNIIALRSSDLSVKRQNTAVRNFLRAAEDSMSTNPTRV